MLGMETIDHAGEAFKPLYYGCIEWKTLEGRYVDVRSTQDDYDCLAVGLRLGLLWEEMLIDMNKEDYLDHGGMYRLTIYKKDNAESDGDLYDVVADYRIERVLKITLIESKKTGIL